METRVVLGESGLLVTEAAMPISFGTGANLVRILVEQGGAEDGYTETVLRKVRVYRSMFSGQTPTVGNCCAGEIEVVMNRPIGSIPRMAQIVPYIRLSNIDRTQKSEWIKKGVFFIDTRELSQNNDGLDILTIHGFDALAKAQADYPNTSSLSYPALDTEIVDAIAAGLGVEVDPRTYDVMTMQYRYGLPVGYSMQEVLGYIAASYAGNFIMTDTRMLRLVTLTELPVETNLLTDELGYALVFGVGEGNEVRILV